MLFRTDQVSLEAREYIEESPPEIVIVGSLLEVGSYELMEIEFVIKVTEVIIMGINYQVGCLEM
jgi:hypothetical protein